MMKKRKYRLNQLTVAVFATFPFWAAQSYAETALPTITVIGNKTAESRDEAGHDAVYEVNYSSEYVGQKLINSYRGTNPSDLLRNFTGVYTGEARNGGAIDPNVRGIQGPGRVPVTVDGAEQAMVVSRGYNGNTNRSYIDPMLIAGMKLVKDGGITDDVAFKTGVGGGLALRTIDARDVLNGRKGFGGEIKLETSSNAAQFESPTNYHGYKPEDIPQSINCKNQNSSSTSGNNLISCAYVRQMPVKNSGQSLNFLSGKDVAGRVALAYAADNWDVMGAYAYRQRGNYYAGKNNAGYYSQNTKQGDAGAWDLSRDLTQYYLPGSEVANTASQTKSYLFKLNVQPTDAQTISMGASRVEALNGDILPAQMLKNIAEAKSVTGLDHLVEQIPLSSININSYHINYKLNPRDNKWLNLNLGAWRTNSNGIQANRPFASYKDYYGADYFSYGKQLYDKSQMRFKDTRYGFNVSNKIALSPKIDMTVFGSLERRNFNANGVNFPFPEYSYWPAPQGRTTTKGAGVNFTFRPTDRLTIDVGGQWSNYRLHDDTLKQALTELNPNDPTRRNFERPIDVGYRYKNFSIHKNELVDSSITQDDLWRNRERYGDLNSKWLGYLNQLSRSANYYNEDEFVANYNTHQPFEVWRRKDDGTTFSTTVTPDPTITFDPNDYDSDARFYDIYDEAIEKVEDQAFADFKRQPQTWKELVGNIDVMPHSDGKYYFADNPCYNGTFNEDQIKEACVASNSGSLESIKKVQLKPVMLKTGHAWTPSLAIAYQLTDNSKIYARYNETVRYPDIAENTVMFLGTSIQRDIPIANKELKPERSHAFELGYTHNLLELFPGAEAADIKLAYYHNKITDVIDRPAGFVYENLEKQTIRGIELDGRYDNGRFFTNFGVSYILQNKVCDENTALVYSLRASKDESVRYPTCIQNGFPWGFLTNQGAPKLSMRLNLGTRLLDRKLELGGRATYYTKYTNKDYDRNSKYFDIYGAYRQTSNPPYGWGNTLILDAYARYRFNKNFSAELSATNLTDQYYLDPANRSLMPAPGRAIKFSLTGRF